MTKMNPRVVEQVFGLHYRNLKVVKLVVGLYHENTGSNQEESWGGEVNNEASSKNLKVV